MRIRSEVFFDRGPAARRGFYAALSCLLPACHSAQISGTGGALVQPVAAPQAAVAQFRSFPVHYENQGKQTTLPLLRATVAGRATSMLLDSGASTHVIAAWLARDARLEVEASPNDEVSDHEGRRLPVHRARGVAVTLESWGAIDEPSFLVMQMPPVFEQQGVGGVISPQQLTRSGAESLVLDLKNGRATLEPSEKAEAGLEEHSGCALTILASPSCADPRLGPRDAPLFAVRSDLDGHAARLLVDTGAIRSDVLADSRAAGGGDRILPNARVRAGECEFIRNVDVIDPAPSATCAHDGALGIDILHSCILVMNRDRILGRCQEDGATSQ